MRFVQKSGLVFAIRRSPGRRRVRLKGIGIIRGEEVESGIYGFMLKGGTIEGKIGWGRPPTRGLHTRIEIIHCSHHYFNSHLLLRLSKFFWF
jgi:hypothetical protein